MRKLVKTIKGVKEETKYDLKFIMFEPNVYYMKSNVMKNGMYQYYLQLRRDDYKEAKANGIVKGYSPRVEARKKELLQQIAISNTNEEKSLAWWNYCSFKTCENIREANKKRLTRLNERIERLLKSGRCVFLTFNFNDETLAKNDQKKLRDLVARYLKKFSVSYVANIDFGSDKEYIDRHGQKRQATKRIHFHAVALIGDNDFNLLEWQNQKRGFIDCELINIDKGSKALAKYVSKLTNHAIKESTKKCCYIYSR